MGVRYLSYLAVLGMIVAAKPAAAQNCGPLPDCEELGFTDNVDDCAEEDRLNCPFDDTSVLCRKKGVRCEIGSILYNDLNCYDTAPDGLTAVGVVFDAVNKLAVAPDNGKLLPWGLDQESVPGLMDPDNHTNSYTVYDIDGRANTEAIVSYYGPGTNYAAGYCNAMVGGLKAGAWFMPSWRQMRMIGYYWDKLNNGLQAAGLSQLSNGTYIPSNQYSAKSTYRLHVPSGGFWSAYKTDNHIFFCATSYGDSSIWKQIGVPYESKECEVGDILYSNLKCYDEPWPALAAIGVVFDTENRLAVSKESVWSVQWGGLADNIPNLEACESESLATTTCATDGKANTKAIVDYFGDYGRYAAKQCNDYAVGDTKKGDWFLPSIKELATLSEVADVVETSLGSEGPLCVNYLLSSTVAKYGDTEVVVYGLSDGYRGYTIRTFTNNRTDLEHRCVINY